MAFVAEDGTGLSAATSYIDVSAADTYFTDRDRNSPEDTWGDATEPAKKAALIKATDYLEKRYANRWRGVRGSDSQALAWPRDDVYVDGVELADDEVPTALVHATAEYAERALSAELVTDPTHDARGAVKVKREKVGPIEEETEYTGAGFAMPRYPAADLLLRPLLLSPGVHRA